MPTASTTNTKVKPSAEEPNRPQILLRRHLFRASMAVCHYMTVWPGCGGFGGIEVCDGEGAEHGGGALSAAGDGALGGAIAEIDVDDAHGPESAQCFGG